MAGFRLGGRRENRFRQLRGLFEAGRQIDAAHGSGFLVFLPARSGKVASNDALNWKRNRLPDQHRTTAKQLRVGCQILGKFLEISRDEVIWEPGETFETRRPKAESESRLFRDRIGENAIERGDAISGDDEKSVSPRSKTSRTFPLRTFTDAREIDWT